jgi:hypothetical protein
MGFDSWKDIGPTDILLSAASIGAPICHGIDDLSVCETSDPIGIATWKNAGFDPARTALIDRLLRGRTGWSEISASMAEEASCVGGNIDELGRLSLEWRQDTRCLTMWAVARLTLLWLNARSWPSTHQSGKLFCLLRPWRSISGMRRTSIFRHSLPLHRSTRRYSPPLL